MEAERRREEGGNEVVSNEVGRDAIVPYDYRFEEEFEKEPPIEEDVIEAEFREVPPVAEVPKIPEDRERARKEREAAEYAERLERARARAAMAGLEKVELMTKEHKAGLALKRAELRRKETQEVVKWGTRAATLGGVPAVQRPGGIRGLYFGRPAKGMYVPRPAPEMYFAGEEREVLREVVAPKLERLREAGALETGAPRARVRTPLMEAITRPPSTAAMTSPMGGLVSVGGQSVALGLMRQLTVPKGLMPIERYAYGEIAGNGDRDTFKHVVSELAAIGISRRDAEQAIKSLLAKGLVKQTREFSGEEPLLEIVQ